MYGSSCDVRRSVCARRSSSRKIGGSGIYESVATAAVAMAMTSADRTRGVVDVP